VEENNVQKKSSRKWLIVAAGVFGASLISAGVFASTQISVNGGSTVNLGAGSATVNVCGSTASISAIQTFDATAQIFKTTTFSITGLASGCANKVLSIAFNNTNGIQTATWSLPSGLTTSKVFQYGYGSNGSNDGTTYQSGSALTAFDTSAQTGSNLSTVAIAVQ
jgi:hypothetical protein